MQNDSIFAEINSDGTTPFGTYNPNNLPSWLNLDPKTRKVGYVSDIILANNAFSVYKIRIFSKGMNSIYGQAIFCLLSKMEVVQLRPKPKERLKWS